jgi:SHS2 domain-containing protein
VSSTGHRPLDHTADLAIELWAPDEPALLVEGARALVELLTDGATVDGTTARVVALEALDAEDRLVRWLAEVLYLATTEGFLVCDAALELSGSRLRGTVRGQADAAERLVTEIKAVTYHDLRLERGPAGFRARVVFDV